MAIIVSIVGQQDPSLSLAEIPKRSIVHFSIETKVAEDDEIEVFCFENRSQSEGFHRRAKLIQVSLHIHDGEQAERLTAPRLFSTPARRAIA